MPTLWEGTLEPSASVTEGKGLVEDKEENKDLLPVIWSVAPESKTQGSGEEDRVRPTKDVLVWATDAVELEDCWSLYHLRNLLNITSISDETKEISELEEAAEDAMEELEEARLRMAQEGRSEQYDRRSELTLWRRRRWWRLRRWLRRRLWRAAPTAPVAEAEAAEKKKNQVLDTMLRIKKIGIEINLPCV